MFRGCWLLVFPAASPWAHLVGCWLGAGTVGARFQRWCFWRDRPLAIGNRLTPQIDKRTIGKISCWLLHPLRCYWLGAGTMGARFQRRCFWKDRSLTIGNRLTPQIGKRTIDNGRAPRGSSSCQSVRCVVPSCIFLSVFSVVSPSWQSFVQPPLNARFHSPTD